MNLSLCHSLVRSVIQFSTFDVRYYFQPFIYSPAVDVRLLRSRISNNKLFYQG
jgi:hypothetical protein